MNTVYDDLKSRNLIKQIIYEDEFIETVKNKKITVYLGIDPSSDSIHIGHFIPLMLLSYFQKHGHNPIILVGGGTALIGDPSGKTDMRKMLTQEDVKENVNKIKTQLNRFLSFEGENKAIIVNNGDWILNLNYMDFISNYGIHFNVNRMLNAECFKSRMERGLTFFELNYMLMQSYDFLHLYEKYNCTVQIGGDDQWSNMLAGVDLIRKLHKNDAFCLTCPLLLTSEGKKMGKTEAGALWLSKEKTSVFDFYQYFRNVSDNDVENILRTLTFLDMKEIKHLVSLEGEALNEAKKIAAFEITKLIHGEEEAIKAKKTSEDMFENSKTNSDNMPSKIIKKSDFKDLNISIVDILSISQITASKSEAKTLITQGGISVNNIKIEDIWEKIDINSLENNYIVIKKGKKSFTKIIFKD